MVWLQLLQLNGNQMGSTENISMFHIPSGNYNLRLNYISLVVGGGERSFLGQRSPYYKINM